MEATLVGPPEEPSNEPTFDVNVDEEFHIDDERDGLEFSRPLANVSVKWLYDGVVEFNLANYDGPSSWSTLDLIWNN